MTEQVSAPYTDQRVRLVILGALQIVLGLLAALAAMCSVVGVFFAGDVPGMSPAATMIPAVTLYALVAVLMIILGAGSIMSRRWARALTLVLGWIGLAMGILTLLVVMVIMPPMMRSLAGESADPAVAMFPMIFAMGCVSLLYIGIPLAMVLLASGRAVRMTVEYRDRVPRWTDAAPLPVLGLAVAYALSAVSMLGVLANPVLPLFGTILTGIPAALIGIVMIALLLTLSWGIYRQRLVAWWAAITLTILGIAIGIPTVLQLDLRRLYETMGLWSPELERMGVLDIYRSPFILALLAISWLALMAYLLWVRRYFIAPDRDAGEPR